MMNKEEQKKFNRTYWRFLWSSILIALSGCLGNVVDAVIVGNLIGEDAVSAINLTKPVVQLMFTLNMLLATGAGMLVGIELGKKNHQGVAYYFTLAMAACLAVALMFSAAGIAFPDVVTDWLCTHDSLRQLTQDYLRMMLIGAPAYMVMWALTTMAGVDGSPRLASIAILIDNAVNLCLDIVFIQWLGWGIAGSSTATVLGHLVGIAIICRHFYYHDNHLRLSLTPSGPSPRALPSGSGQSLFSSLSTIISQGAPQAVACGCLAALYIACNTTVGSVLGRVGLFALAVCMNLLQIYNLFLAGVERTIQALGSIEVGRGDNATFQLILRKSFRFITISMLLVCAIVWVFPEAIARFFGAEGEATISETVSALRAFALSFFMWCYLDTLMVVYKLYSHHKMALFISFALSLTVIPTLWVIAHLAPQLIWYSFLIAYILEALLILLFHRIGHLHFILPTQHTTV
jgi:Na+-driven multidrug efflux pump